MSRSFNVGDLAILEYSYCFPEYNGEICEVVAPLKERLCCRTHKDISDNTNTAWENCYLIHIEGAKYMPLAAAPRQLKPLPPEHTAGNMHEITKMLGWVPRENRKPVTEDV